MRRFAISADNSYGRYVIGKADNETQCWETAKQYADEHPECFGFVLFEHDGKIYQIKKQIDAHQLRKEKK